jgi:DnaJ-class molecular chaperone
MKCPICEGKGKLLEDVMYGDELWEPCTACKSTGKVNLWWKIQCWFFDTKLAAWLYDF